MNSKPMEFSCDGIILRGKLDMPETGAEKLPLLILLHGLTGNMDEPHITAVAQTAVEVGYAVLRVDQYGHGTSDGEFYNHNVMIWMLQAMQVIDTARSWPFVSKIVLAGHSQGGLNTILTGGMMADRLQALIPMSPAVNIVYGARSGNLLGVPFDGDSMPDLVAFDGRPLSANYIRTARMLPVDYAVSRFRGPVLIVHGTEDEAVPYALAPELVAQYANARLAAIPGDDHCFTRHLDQLTAAVRDFLIQLRQE